MGACSLINSTPSFKKKKLKLNLLKFLENSKRTFVPDTVRRLQAYGLGVARIMDVYPLLA